MLQANSSFLLLLAALLSLFSLTLAVPERDPYLRIRDGFILDDFEEIFQYCPRCATQNKLCCLGINLQQYSCMPNYTALAVRSAEDFLCAADGTFCGTDYINFSPNSSVPINPQSYTGNCQDLYLSVATCTAAPPQFAFCYQTSAMRSVPTKCIFEAGLPPCSDVSINTAADYAIYGVYLAFELVVFLVFVTGIHFQPLKARGRLISFLIIALGVVLPTIFIILQQHLPCPIYLFFAIVGFPFYGFLYIVRDVNLYSIWVYQDFKRNVIKYIVRLRIAAKKSKTQGYAELGEDDEIETNEYEEREQQLSESEYASLLHQEKRKISIVRVITRSSTILLSLLAFSLFPCIAFIILVAIKSQVLGPQLTYWTIASCPLEFGALGIIGGFVLLDLVVLVVLAIVMRKIRDAFYMKISSFIDLILAIVGYAILLMFLALAKLFNAQINAASGIYIVAVTTQTVSILIPGIHAIILAIRKKVSPLKQKKEETSAEDDVSAYSNVRKVLTEKKLKRAFVNFCNKEFSPENPLCWEEIQKYKRMKSSASRKERALEIHNAFIKRGAFLELNIDNKKREELITRITKKQDSDVTLFDKLESELELVMNDTFARFEATTEFAQLVAQALEEKRKYKEMYG